MIPTPRSFQFSLREGVATVTFSRPATLNSLTFEVYAELRDFLPKLSEADEVRAVVVAGEGRGFCSGGDRHAIIAELFSRDVQGLLEFTRMTGALIRNLRRLRRPVVAAVHGVAVGAGAVIALACDVRIVGRGARFGFIFPQVGLCGADMGAAYLLPRVVGLGNASHLLFTGELIGADEALRIGLANRVVDDEQVLVEANAYATRLAQGPAFAHAMTKQLIEDEHRMGLDDALEAEAQAQALCMMHPDFKAAYEAAIRKETPKFKGAP
ncbi:MAG: enoyl-CoA hydratase family protein [Myxococcales bacterium]|nr:enoyl-CoA hydratase family protein [Polyangiaceae bacterium]MDW8247921.1 enoyl-CoA hydratase family protein [Myxococcales bacterium]